MAGPIDTHVHLFDPDRFASDTHYRPQPHECGTVDMLLGQMAGAGVRGAFLVAPTVGHGHDLSPLLEALARHPDCLYGVARLTGLEGDDRLLELAQKGIRGVRLDLRHDDAALLDVLDAMAAPRRWWRHGWFIQVQADASMWARVHERLSVWPNPLVIDHCGLPDPAKGVDQAGFQAVLALSRRPATWAKLSGPFRFSHVDWPHPDADEFAARLFEAYGTQGCLWGSDWPFVRTGLRLPYAEALGQLTRWVPDATARDEILCASPAALLKAGAR